MQDALLGLGSDASIEYLISFIILLLESGDEDRALEEWLRAVDTALESGQLSRLEQLFRRMRGQELSHLARARVEFARANWWERLEKNDEAVAAYRQAMRVFRRFGVERAEAQTANNLALLYQKMGKNAYAVTLFHVAARLYGRLQEHESRGEVRSNIGGVADAQRNWQDAIPYYRQAERDLRRAGAKRQLAGVLNNLGVANEMLGLLERAESAYRASLEVLQEIDQADSEAGWRIQGNIAELLSNRDDLEGAIRQHRAALTIAIHLGSDSLHALSLNNLGTLFDKAGDKQKALESYQAALSYQRELGDQATEAMLLNNLGSVFTDIGEFEQAQVSLAESIALCAEVKDLAGEARSLNNLAVLRERQGQLDASIVAYEKAAQRFSSIGDKRRQTLTLINLAAVSWKKRDEPVARRAFLKAWRLAQNDAFANELALLYQLRGDVVASRPKGKPLARRWYERAAATCTAESLSRGLAERLDWLSKSPE